MAQPEGWQQGVEVGVTGGCCTGVGSGAELADHQCQRIEKQYRQEPEQPERHTAWNDGSNVWPSRPGEPQYEWEPPRVVDYSVFGRHRSSTETVCTGRDSIINAIRRQTQPPLGGNVDGASHRLDNAELYQSCDNRTDELRLLGNGVCPPTAARAWQVLYQRLADQEKHNETA